MGRSAGPLCASEAILDGRQPKGLRLAEMLGNGPLAWNMQKRHCGFNNAHEAAQRVSVSGRSLNLPVRFMNGSSRGGG
jgi:hypothetical protein